MALAEIDRVIAAGVRFGCVVADAGYGLSALSIPAEDMLADAKWQTVSWRTGTKGKPKARFAAVRVRVADGPPQRIRDKGQQHLPGDEVSANTGCRERGSTTSPICLLRPICALWLLPSRHDGFASKRISR